ncbi:hypothetical protein H4J51_00895 [Colwellia sp. MB02u-18]|uniref:hypothetical protein n=1 Tax=unclassified Colwellia TaxID=196834 RepID=UPI0015F35479|nr:MULTISPECIES: hypothetical protein [unclassified Colwellia]MBA6223073.1 hypothetical protein [Colwellia sp. MB3u-45]MBA6267497.1 hypothetical protein [Colwellia sp. MB3u-43]MBA6320376.1 hypothetical protein [Colwellia sp. MB02u-19]MBA6323135.1 hypothetical protein [Colwellia sp. MB02u-18]MBA6330468.1 hypothetical protein [Colwellia sp. MB02u-12]
MNNYSTSASSNKNTLNNELTEFDLSHQSQFANSKHFRDRTNASGHQKQASKKVHKKLRDVFDDDDYEIEE